MEIEKIELVKKVICPYCGKEIVVIFKNLKIYAWPSIASEVIERCDSDDQQSCGRKFVARLYLRPEEETKKIEGEEE